MLLRFFAPYPIHLRLPASLALHEAFTALSVPRRSVARCPLSLAEAATNKNNLHCSSSGKGALQLHAGHSPLARQFLRLLGGFARPAAVAAGASTKDGPLHRLPLRKRLKMIKRIDPKAQRMILVQGLGRPRCQRAQQLLKRGGASQLLLPSTVLVSVVDSKKLTLILSCSSSCSVSVCSTTLNPKPQIQALNPNVNTRTQTPNPQASQRSQRSKRC